MPRQAAEGDPIGSARHARQEPDRSRQLAHELNNLLDGSLRNLSLALAEMRDHGAAEDADEPLAEETAQRLRTANDSMQQMAALLQRWMAAEGGTSGSEAAGAQARPPGETLGGAIESARRQIEPLVAARRIALSVELPAELTDQPAGALQQVIHNALRNAVEAVDREGQIELRCAREGEWVVLRVRDDGPGPAPGLPWEDDALPQPGATTKPGGHGMGLTISRRIAESMGGSLRLDAGDAGGAVLTLRWPALPTGPDAAPNG